MKEIHLVFTPEQLAILDYALQGLTIRQGMPLVNEINRQVQAQAPIIEAAPGDNFDLTRG